MILASKLMALYKFVLCGLCQIYCLTHNFSLLSKYRKGSRKASFPVAIVIEYDINSKIDGSISSLFFVVYARFSAQDIIFFF